MVEKSKMQALREEIAKVHRCYRNCGLYPSLCRKFYRCWIKCDSCDYELADIHIALFNKALPELTKEAGYKSPEEVDELQAILTEKFAAKLEERVAGYVKRKRKKRLLLDMG